MVGFTVGVDGAKWDDAEKDFFDARYLALQASHGRVVAVFGSCGSLYRDWVKKLSVQKV